MFSKILEYAGTYKRKMISATILQLVGVLMGVLPFWFAYQMIVPLVDGKTLEPVFVGTRVVAILVCFVLQAFLYAKGSELSHQLAYNTLLSLRVSLQSKVEQLPLGEIQNKGAGALKKLFVDDVDSLELLLAHSLPEGIANLIIPAVVYITMFIVDWKLALLSLASLPISIVAMKLMYSVGMKRMGPYYQAGQTMNNTIIEYINGMEVIKIFNRESESYDRFRNDVANYRDYTLNWYKACWPWMAIYSSLLPCTIILTLPLGTWFVLQGYSVLSHLILVLCLSLSIGIPLLKALGFLPTLPQLNYKTSALEQAISAPPLQQGKNPFSGMDYTVSFNDVVFAYEEQTVIDHVSMKAKSRQKTALVGESGSGKSTLTKLLVHYYDVQAGSISIGGQDICDMTLETLNASISYVAQDQYLFNTSIYENIRLGKQSATEEEILNAATEAECMEFIQKMPEGIYSTVGSGGTKLSGGQRQRISLARALLKNAPIIVLDEATAFTDPENEGKIEKAIEKLVKDKTVIVIAHKVSSIQNADQICVMDAGQLIAGGTHDELLKSCPQYQKLWNATKSSTRWKVAAAKEGE